MKNQDLMEILKEYFEKRDDILMAFLFGSHAKATTHKESDVDVAIYFRPESKVLEWEELDLEYDLSDREGSLRHPNAHHSG